MALYPEVSCFEPPMQLDAVVAALDARYVADAVVDVRWWPAVTPTSVKATYYSVGRDVAADDGAD